MLLININSKKKITIVADHEGLNQLVSDNYSNIELEHLTCGHYIFPHRAKYSHQEVVCPLCGKYYTGKGFEKPNESFNGKQLRPMAIGIHTTNASPHKLKNKIR